MLRNVRAIPDEVHAVVRIITASSSILTPTETIITAGVSIAEYLASQLHRSYRDFKDLSPRHEMGWVVTEDSIIGANLTCRTEGTLSYEEVFSGPSDSLVCQYIADGRGLAYSYVAFQHRLGQIDLSRYIDLSEYPIAELVSEQAAMKGST